jgi:alkanesulfonate monooxygenase SsuD/methylene tetrahydromethanopterin reductase-like flavin-dependent oxidoreductase (luciferase family)
LLLPFRRAAVVAEELAWLDARFPGRVGAGFGSGGNQADFAAMDVPFDERAARFDAELRQVARLLRPTDPPHALAGDRAIARVHQQGLPLLSAAMSGTAVRRAAELDLGIIGSSLLDDAATIRLVDRYRAAGGTGPHVVIARVWLGQPPWQLIEQQLAHYREASETRSPAPGRAAAPGGEAQGDAKPSEAKPSEAKPSEAKKPSEHKQGEAPRGEGLLHDDDPASLAARLVAKLEATRADACNLRIHVAGLDPAQAREQIARVGAEVVPLVRRAWSPTDRSA